MKKIVVFVSLFSFALLNAQSVRFFEQYYNSTYGSYRIVDVINNAPDTLNQKDNKGQAQGFWQHALYDSLTKKIFIDREGRYVDGKKQGQWKYYHVDGSLRGIGIFTDDMLDGNYETYYKGGSISEKGTWSKTHAIGKCYSYSPLGYLRMETTFDASGKLVETINFYHSGFMSSKENDTVRMRFYDNGNSSSVVHLKDKQLNGYSYAYDRKGIIKEKRFHVNGSLNGKTFLYHPNGNLKMVGDYKNGHPYGERTYFNEDGSLTNGSFVFYDEQGNKEREGICVNGKPEGIVKFFGKNNTLYASVEHKGGKPHGLYTYYNPDGSIRNQETYKNGEFTGPYYPKNTSVK